MEEHQEAMVKSLVAVAWADGRVDSEESEVIDALLDAFQLTGDDAEMVRQYAKEPRSLDDVPLTDLSDHDRRLLLQHAVILTYIDGEQSEKEREVLRSLVHKLHLPEEEAAELVLGAEQRAQRLLELL